MTWCFVNLVRERSLLSDDKEKSLEGLTREDKHIHSFTKSIHLHFLKCWILSKMTELKMNKREPCLTGTKSEGK